MTALTLDPKTIVLRAADTKTITFADSPYTLLVTDDAIEVDCTNGDVVINFYTYIDNINRKLLLRKIDASANTIIPTAFGAESITGGNPVISVLEAVEEYRVFTSSWGRI